MVVFPMRVYWALVGIRHALQIFFLPVWSGKWWRELIHEIRWNGSLQRAPSKYVGHNTPAQLPILFLILIPLIFQFLTGFALYTEGQGSNSWWYATLGWVLGALGDDSFFVHTVHRLIMWVFVCFAIVHTYGAIREEISSRQSRVSTMLSGWHYFKDEKR